MSHTTLLTLFSTSASAWVVPASPSLLSPRLRAASALRQIHACAPNGEQWFVKTETFSKPYPVVKPYLEQHREWVAALRSEGRTMTSGYRVNAEGKPGGGGLLLFAAADHAAALALVTQDPLIANDCVEWQLNRWIPEVGDIELV